MFTRCSGFTQVVRNKSEALARFSLRFVAAIGNFLPFPAYQPELSLLGRAPRLLAPRAELGVRPVELLHVSVRTDPKT